MRELVNWFNLGANPHTKLTGHEDTFRNSFLAKIMINKQELFRKEQEPNPEEYITFTTEMPFDIMSEMDDIIEIDSLCISEIKNISKYNRTIFKIKDFQIYYYPYEQILYYDNNLNLEDLFINDLALLHMLNVNFPLLGITEKDLARVKDDKLKSMLKLNLSASKNLFKKHNYLDEIKKLVEAENKLYDELKIIRDDKAKLEKNAWFDTDDALETIDDLANFLVNHQYIESVNIETLASNATLEIKIKTKSIPMLQFDKFFIMRNKGKFRGYSDLFAGALYEVAQGNATLYFGTFDITISVTGAGLQYNILNLDHYNNPHKSINCLGTWRRDIDKAIDNRDVVALVYTLFQYLHQITFTDGGSSSIDNNCYILDSEGKVIYDAQISN